jgi:predicted O-methyltransferase YrrM
VGDSVEVSKDWEIPLGLLFIDGGHSMDAAKNDFNSWSKHIVPGGILAIHDVFPDPKDGGRPPYEIFCLAKSSEKFIEIEMVNSLAILKKV